MDERHALTAPADAGRLDRWLASALPISRSRITGLIDEGRVRVDGRAARPSQKLVGGELVEVSVPPPPSTALVAQDLDVPLLYQDEHLLVVHKPAGMVVHPAAGHRDGTLVNALLPAISAGEGDEPWDPARPGIVHRLDRGTSGVLVVARTPEAHEGLARQFAAHTADRRYVALVWGQPRDLSGTIDAPLGRHPTDRLRFAVVPDGRRAVTHWRARGTTTDPRAASLRVSVLECRLETGRTHQVRVHLQHLGHPVVGDPLYRRSGPVPDALRPLVEGIDHQLLHAWRLGFTHPITGANLCFEAPPPPELVGLATALGLGGLLPAT